MSDNKDDSKVRVICMMCKYYEKGLFNLTVCQKCCHYIEYDVKYVPYHIECKKKNTHTSDPRAGKKNHDKEKEDLRKAIWYINHYIEAIEGDDK